LRELCVADAGHWSVRRGSSPSASLRASAQAQQLSLRTTRAVARFFCHPERSEGSRWAFDDRRQLRNVLD
jgi:hypothetical protein